MKENYLWKSHLNSINKITIYSFLLKFICVLYGFINVNVIWKISYASRYYHIISRVDLKVFEAWGFNDNGKIGNGEAKTSYFYINDNINK